MNRDIFIRNLTKDRIEMSPKGRNANELTPEEFEKCYENFFDMIFEIAATDISSLSGYGEFDENNKAPYDTLEEFIRDEVINEKTEGYWKNWTQMFGTTFLEKEYYCWQDISAFHNKATPPMLTRRPPSFRTLTPGTT